MAKLKSIAVRLEIRGVKPIKTDNTTIWITESLYIQVKPNSVVVFKNDASGMSMYECSNRIDDIMDKLKQAIGV